MDKKLIMYDVRKKLSKTREMCVGMSEGLYALTDYIAEVADDSMSPEAVAMILFFVIDDIQNDKSGYAKQQFSEYIINNREQVLEQAVYFPQVIDAIASKSFAKEFRSICRELLEYDPPKR